MPVRFTSTRGDERVSFEEALLTGLAPDGGLYIPASIPRFPSDLPPDLSFADLGVHVLHAWLSAEVAEEALTEIVRDALDFDVPVVPLDGDDWAGVYVLELFHGPTLSFKDFGARTMARLMGHFLKRREDDVTILVATSGDTGSAVADGFAGQDRIDVVLLYPKGKVSPTQERQLIIRRPGVRALAVKGDFDDCQRMVKEAFVDPSLSDANLSSANSINIGRLLPQMLYYIWAARALPSNDTLFCVPSGNLGNLTAGVLAHLSGMPVRRFLAAHNANDFFPRHLRGHEARFAPTVRTLSNAMDVGAPSNFERLQSLLPGRRMRDLIQGHSVTDEETRASMRRIYESTGYVADPHTAVGLEAVRRRRIEGDAAARVVVLSTAHPGKFPETVEETLGFAPTVPARLAQLWDREIAVETIEPNLEALRAHLVD